MVWAALAFTSGLLVVTLAGAPSALANTTVQECVDIEAIAGLSLTPQGRARAAELVRQGHPAREYLCFELGWDCDNDPSLQLVDTDTDEAEGCAGAIDEDESRCEAPGSDGAWESFAGALLEIPPPPGSDVPLGRLACFDDPTLCSALPPPASGVTFTHNPIPVVNDRAHLSTPRLTLLRETADHAHFGVGPADAPPVAIDRPPQGARGHR